MCTVDGDLTGPILFQNPPIRWSNASTCVEGKEAVKGRSLERR